METLLLTRREAAAALGVGLTTFDILTRTDDTFPRKIWLGPKVLRFSRAAIEEWIAAQTERGA